LDLLFGSLLGLVIFRGFYDNNNASLHLLRICISLAGVFCGLCPCASHLAFSSCGWWLMFSEIFVFLFGRFAGLWGGHLLLRYIENYRVVWLGGRYGSGKTALAFMIAHELMKTGRYHYIFSNTASVWNDDPDKAVLRPDEAGIETFIDCIIILDEAGEFMATRSQAQAWLSYLRKLNIVLILPSVLPPANDVRFVTVRREFDMSVIGIPIWFYKMSMSIGDIDETHKFQWFLPQCIYGIYDTLSLTQDADFLLHAIKGWIDKARLARGGNISNATRQIFFSDMGTNEQIDNEGFADALLSVEKGIKRSISTLNKGRWRRR